jgi:hypothetical protein
MPSRCHEVSYQVPEQADPADSPERRNLIRDSAQSKLKQPGAH